MIRIPGIKAPLDYTDALLLDLAARKLGVNASSLKFERIARRSVDARDKGNLHFSVSIDVSLTHSAKLDEATLAARCPQASVIKPAVALDIPRVKPAKRPVVVGFGPAGMFAALYLARAGACPIVLERGPAIEQRAQDVENFWRGAPLDECSNVLFGEGGAGTFSDGKLTTGIKDPRCDYVLRTLCDFGAPADILFSAKPHIGTDLLRSIVRSVRERVIELGGEVRFQHRLSGIETTSSPSGERTLASLTVTSPKGTYSLTTDSAILATGHSARDVYALLRDLDVSMQAKAFSIGARIEHPQNMVNFSQYGNVKHTRLGAADYKLSRQLPDGRGVYTFCMCPGGQVVASASELGGIVTNGMSLHARDGVNANSALLVGVSPADFGSDDPLAGIEFQRRYERLAHKLANGDDATSYNAPAQRCEDFLKGRPSTRWGAVKPSYRPGVIPGDLAKCLPVFVVESMRTGILAFERQLRGFALPDAVLTGVETRSSAPVRIDRDELGHSSVRGLFPTGEGAGWAGGIMSAAVDGLKQAERAVSINAAP